MAKEEDSNFDFDDEDFDFDEEFDLGEDEELDDLDLTDEQSVADETPEGEEEPAQGEESSDQPPSPEEQPPSPSPAEEPLPIEPSPEHKLRSPGAIPLTIAVEVARFSMSIDKISQLQPGNTLELNAHPEDGVDLVVNGRRVGRAELVRIGETLGVRIVELG